MCGHIGDGRFRGLDVIKQPIAINDIKALLKALRVIHITLLDRYLRVVGKALFQDVDVLDRGFEYCVVMNIKP